MPVVLMIPILVLLLLFFFSFFFVLYDVSSILVAQNLHNKCRQSQQLHMHNVFVWAATNMRIPIHMGSICVYCMI